MCVEVITFIALALYLGMLLYFQIQREKIIMKQINPTHANSRTTHERDLISRADALMELNGACSNWEDDATVAEIIKALPSADAERETVTVYRGECTVHWDRPHGEWRKGEVKYDVDDDVLYETYYKCDQCGYVENLDYPPNYCANCGADMRTEYKLPDYEEIMEKLDKLTLKGGGDDDGER